MLIIIIIIFVYFIFLLNVKKRTFYDLFLTLCPKK